MVKLNLTFIAILIKFQCAKKKYYMMMNTKQKLNNS